MSYNPYSIRSASQDTLLCSGLSLEEAQAFYDQTFYAIMVLDQDGVDVTDAFEANAPWANCGESFDASWREGNEEVIDEFFADPAAYIAKHQYVPEANDDDNLPY
jgi:hypothetical protein